ncbi:tripartite tricarboxylate transporter TctB family protein [Anaerobacterium chartisolvens]|uniref:Tripartite tricarboxylate transporter TctB family protein n=1 Tax=Anaerobacterium chartisolvens TaxID=1297424 RepID=A0A369BFV4_9FIRM|nr:tripartite tricarboxylate transporter TctB family protein [Anaerobacterium chartisolvens]RCX19357.1 tripartite tricarboxylate transporter TctB family protein [Anaerobacterium chartisolvens]
MTNMKKCNFVISIIAAVVGAAIVYASSGLGIGMKQKGGIEAGTWPAIMGCILLAASVILLSMTLLNKKKYEGMEVTLALPANMRVYVMMGIFAIYCIVLRVLGLYLSVAILIPVIMLVLGERNKKKITVVTIGTVLGIFLIFGLILGTKLPQPIWM